MLSRLQVARLSAVRLWRSVIASDSDLRDTPTKCSAIEDRAVVSDVCVVAAGEADSPTPMVAAETRSPAASPTPRRKPSLLQRSQGALLPIWKLEH